METSHFYRTQKSAIANVCQKKRTGATPRTGGAGIAVGGKDEADIVEGI